MKKVFIIMVCALVSMAAYSQDDMYVNKSKKSEKKVDYSNQLVNTNGRLVDDDYCGVVMYQGKRYIKSVKSKKKFIKAIRENKVEPAYREKNDTIVAVDLNRDGEYEEVKNLYCINGKIYMMAIGYFGMLSFNLDDDGGISHIISFFKEIEKKANEWSEICNRNRIKKIRKEMDLTLDGYKVIFEKKQKYAYDYDYEIIIYSLEEYVIMDSYDLGEFIRTLEKIIITTRSQLKKEYDDRYNNVYEMLK